MLVSRIEWVVKIKFKEKRIENKMDVIGKRVNKLMRKGIGEKRRENFLKGIIGKNEVEDMFLRIMKKMVDELDGSSKREC